MTAGRAGTRAARDGTEAGSATRRGAPSRSPDQAAALPAAVVASAAAVVLAALGPTGPLVGQEGAPPSGEPGDFLRRLTGEWSVVAEAIPGSGQDPLRTEARAVVRMLGGQWLVAENDGTTPGGHDVSSILTLGYDPGEERFVGTWISSMQTHLWQYTGELDEAGRALTLATEGPVMGDATRTARYREIIEVEDDDHFVMRSLILGPDDEWFEFAIAEYSRIEP